VAHIESRIPLIGSMLETLEVVKGRTKIICHLLSGTRCNKKYVAKKGGLVKVIFAPAQYI
jgi:hypothetical protein